ncbi:Oidioi.mRNA.OKI2018_I69.chr2.g5455.t1.cds [Oikopleura dioica]|uniref:Oidioi.mRNA.OKI2018_I69.chr2.g5455.t1.cds n=1 Tax=Oikopleura dioica TaxID=34765 RepID=A0ABN7T6Y9_OIKDI|nr:Oidioi.mRNA.OKI2018_I69.chr2.g5455.t1.cds [Oikopleura dioica]
MFKDDKETQSLLTDIFGLTYIMSVPLSPAPGAIVDFVAKKYRHSENNHEKGQRVGIAINCLLITISTVILSYLCTFQNSVSIAITAEVIFSIIRTFLYAVCAQAAFLLFPNHLFGLIYGFLNLLNGLATLLADPIFRIIQGPLKGDYTLVHYILAILVFSTIIQNIHLLRNKSEAEVKKTNSNLESSS